MTARNNCYDGIPLPEGTTEIDIWVKGPDGLLKQETRTVDKTISTVPYEVADALRRNGIDVE